MGIRDILKPSAAKIGEQLSAAEAVFAAAAATHQQAEADAVAASADPDKYGAAAERAAQSGAKYSVANDRLRRLQQAHQAAAECEQADYITRLEAAEREEQEALQAAVSALAARRVEEVKRHESELASLGQQEAAAHAAAEKAKDNLRRARAGLTEASAKRIAELAGEELRIRKSYHENLDHVVAEARARFHNAQKWVRDLEDSNRVRGGHAQPLEDARREQVTAGRILQDHNDLLTRRNAEIAAIRQEIDQLKAVCGE